MPTVTGSVVVGGVASVGAGGITDGDKGDVTVTDDGATWTIDDGVVTPAKLTFDPATQTELDTLAAAANSADTALATTIATETAARSSGDSTNATNLTTHIGSTTAHAASSIPFTPTGTIGATTVQAAIAEVAAEAGGGGGVADGDHGDITISGSGTTYTIDNGVVTPAKLTFDPATQTELDAEATTRADADTALSGSITTLTASVGTKVAKTGDTMTGALTIDPAAGSAVLTLDAAATGTAGVSNSDAGRILLTIGGVSKSAVQAFDVLSLGIWTTQIYDQANSRALLSATNGAAGSATTTITDRLQIARGTSGQTANLLSLNDHANVELAAFTPLANFLAAAGSVTVPAISRVGDTNTGVYYPAADTWALTTGGTARLTIDTAAVTSTLPLRVPAGTTTAPQITDSTDTTTGLSFAGTDTMIYIRAGAEAWRCGNEGHIGMFGKTNPQNAWIYIGAGTGTAGDHTGGTAATRMGIKVQLDTVSGTTPQDAIHSNVKIVSGTSNESCNAYLGVVDVYDTGGDATSQTVAVNGNTHGYAAGSRPLFGGNFIATMENGSGYLGALIGCEVQAENDDAGTALNGGAGLSITNKGVSDVRSAIMSVANAAFAGGYQNFLTTTTATNSKPKKYWAWHGPLGTVSSAPNGPNGVPAWAVTCDDATGVALRIGQFTSQPAFLSAGSSPTGMNQSAVEIAMYSIGNKIVFVVNDAGTLRYKSLTLTGTGVTWVHSTTAPT